jgi:DNA-binding ferritin-like protein
MYKQAFHVAEEADEQGVANFIAERIDAHAKWQWQLRSILKVTRA